MSGAIGIFAKTPGLTPAKTRLAASIGTESAEQFYRLSLDAIEEIVQTAVENKEIQLKPYWAVAEEQGVGSERWRSFEAIWTGEGGLGDRLHQVYDLLISKHDYVLLMGTDSPQLSPETIIESAKIAQKYKEKTVVGPCADGGFYLFGSNQHFERSGWTNTPYSQSDTLVELQKNLSLTPIFLSEKQDVDVFEDLQKLQAYLSSQKLLRSQKKILEWMKEQRPQLV